MRSADVSILQTLVNAANSWRTAALAQSVNLDILTTRINGEIVQLEWDPNSVMWEIRTATTTFQMVWTVDNTDPSKSKWVVVSN